MSVNPFGDMFGDIFSLLQQQGPDAWYQTASQLALSIARGDDGDPNAEPVERQRLEELAPLVARHVDALFDVAVDATIEAVNRSTLTSAALEQWRPLIAPMVATGAELAATSDDEQNQMMSQMALVLGPLFVGFQMGSVAGHFSERAWSLAALPLPRHDARRLLVVNNLAHFAAEWSLERDEVYVFALAQEFVASLILSQPGTSDALRALLLDSVHEASALQGNLMTRLQTLMQQGDLNELMGDPAQLLEGIELPDDSPATRAINAASAALLALFSAVALEVTTALLGPRPALAEANQRHRRSDARGEDAAAALFGISTQGPHHESAERFVATLSEQHSLKVFDAFLRVDGLPSADELNTPDAWFERVTNSPLA
ncbi:MAG TPA: zinc-dependent metalloprotease [Acidimicrobiales bacterium]|nr:zinc-dependent metalloprotease [Acidimicrobiales bacterium]